MNKKIIANFFWSDEKKFTVYEYACVNSFVKNGFQVDLYSYDKIKLPKGATLKKASSIINKKDLRSFVHDGKKGCLAAFSDKFRIHLMKNVRGWYFDCDILCLRNVKQFLDLEKDNDIIIGLETKNNVNNAILKIENKKILEIILSEIKKMGYKFKWGDIGPNLITKILKSENKFNTAIDQKIFYPLNYKSDFKLLLLPGYDQTINNMTKDSLTIHNYNQILTRFGIPKNIMPPMNSFLYKKFIQYCPEFKDLECLPIATAQKLLSRRNGFKENIKDLIPSLARAISIKT
tara:strand:- start:465 stop:1334 length:870 start_codon:yes stop_codon:yes gene_type:complete